MLWTDSDIVAAADFRSTDPDFEDVIVQEQMDFDDLLEQSWQDCSHLIQARSQNFTGFVTGLGISAAHQAAVLNTGASPTARPYIRLSQIALAPQYARHKHPIQRWLEYGTLVRTYRAAINRTISDRYQARFENFQALSDDMWQRVRSVGVPIVMTPLPCPGATHEENSGVWDETNLSQSASVGAVGGAFDVAVTWVSSGYVDQTNRANAESGPSRILAKSVDAGNVLSVNIASLNALSQSSQQLGTSDGSWAMASPTGWNVWVGASGSGILYLQTASPVPFATKTYTLAADPVLSGYRLHKGQVPDYNFVFSNMVHRG